MRLLLDTHALLWFLAGDNALSTPARSAIESPANEKFVSHASAWEVAIKLSLGKLKLDVPYEEVFPTAVLANGFSVVTPRFDHYRALVGLPWHHRDPFDRLLVAVARLDSLTIVSKDPHLSAYGVKLLW